ncbi:MAG TPA: glycosyltransferase family 39 protein [Candidatus Paceibacterota bacterium]|nr:glycosyltransferase family 39 protein [Candidatus Paceibacterota bacterium]
MKKFVNNLSPSAPILALAGILAVSFSLMLWASSGDSAIMDELAHIPAGYSYLNNLDYRLNPEHPPLVKAIAALPLTFLNLYFPTDDPAWTKEVNGQWDMGNGFLYGSGNDADYIIHSARILPMILTILLVMLIYAWAAELLGPWWGLIPAMLFGLSPTVLAHGHYVTTDVGAAFGVVLATYYFIKFTALPSRKSVFIAGLAFGAAQLMKFSTVLLIPYFVILILFLFASSLFHDWDLTEPKLRMKRFSIRAWHYIKSIIIVFAVGYLVVVYPVYALFTLNYPQQRQTADTEFILASFAGGPTPAGHICKPMRCLADIDIWMTKNSVTKPFAQYLLGVLMVLQRSSGGNTSYFMGEVSNGGSPSYFPTIYALKETLPVLLIVLMGILIGLQGFFAAFKNKLSGAVKYFFKRYLVTSFPEFSMLLFIIIYWGYSMRSPLNIGIRHLLPTFPFIYILAVSAWEKSFNFHIAENDGDADYKPFGERIKKYLELKANLAIKVLLFALLGWSLLETAFAGPYFLSYFNELGGGVYGGYRFVTDSNYDWGQDLLRLQDFVNKHSEIKKIAVDYFGGGNPSYYLSPKEVDWSSSKGNPADKGIHWLAVSVNTLQSAIQPLAPGQTRNPQDEYRWLTAMRPPAPGLGNVPAPDYRAGTSIFIYRL